RRLKEMARPADGFNPKRYFGADEQIEFYNVGTETVRAMAKALYREHRDEWSVADALIFANTLIKDPHLEAKGLGIAFLARYRDACTPRLLAAWKGWLVDNHASNWATTDAICGYLVGPLIVMHPQLAQRMAAWSSHSNRWVRRASAVGLIPSVRN